jgi:hypothetical protein
VWLVLGGFTSGGVRIASLVVVFLLQVFRLCYVCFSCVCGSRVGLVCCNLRLYLFLFYLNEW